MASKRDYERRRYEKQQARFARAAARRRRHRLVAIVTVVVLALAGTAATVLALTLDDSPATASPSSAPSAPDPALAQSRTWTGVMTLTQGDIGLQLDGAAAPQAVAVFTQLAQQGFYDGLACHRLVNDGTLHILQCGDPLTADGDLTNAGQGDPGYLWGPIENAPADGVYPAWTIAMARRSGDAGSMGSQFFLVFADSTIPADEAGGYTVFGHITSGLDVLQAIADAGTGADAVAPATAVTIEGVEIQ